MKTLLLLYSTTTLIYCSVFDCLSSAFQSSCKSLLYECLNDSECSYQFNINSRHIILDQHSTKFPSLYFSNPLALKMYDCLKKECDLPAIDNEYPKKLPIQHCMFQVFDICGGQNMEQIYNEISNNSSTSEHVKCYRQHCSKT